ncbi:MAG TPA: hypothetical protein VG722_04975, partial [Tepidisphaeraceae bacterium]|nr:hypothetical protein [Tepidisphaeraceae bacterium]
KAGTMPTVVFEKTLYSLKKGGTMTNQELDNDAEAQLETELESFTGTENYYQHWLRLVFTDGVKYLAEKAGAYWLIDAIASWQAEIQEADREFELWELIVNPDSSAVLECRRDSGEPAIVSQKIDYTDFPLKSIKLYVQNGVLMLPSEY